MNGHQTQGRWRLAVVVAPLPTRREALAFNGQWEGRTRGAVPRAAQAEWLAIQYGLECYGNLEAIAGVAPTPPPEPSARQEAAESQNPSQRPPASALESSQRAGTTESVGSA